MKTTAIVIGMLVGWMGLGGQETPAPLRTFHVNNQVTCLDGPGGGTAETPFCSLRHVAGLWRAGDLILLHSKRDGSGPAEFTRGGSATAPVIVRGVGDVKPVIGSFVDVTDEDFLPTDVPGIFRLPGAPSGTVWQTHWPDIVVDDPNQSKYTMQSKDGPLQLAAADSEQTLLTVEGTYRRGADGLRVHPYGKQRPSTATADFVIGTGVALTVASNLVGLVFDNLHITYAGSVYTFTINGTGHKLLNMQWSGVPLTLRGAGHVVNNYSIAHVHQRDASGNYLWHYRGSGIAAIIGGWNHRLTNGHLYHSWNASASTETAQGVIFDGVRAHGSPNHCGVGTQGNTVLRNLILYNCQDYQWVSDINNMVIEHLVIAGNGIPIEAIKKPLGPITVRNSILRGQFVWVRGLPERCTWEAGSVLENSVVDASASVERCDGKTYPLATYVAKCASGEFENCMTVRNVGIVSDWKQVITDGMWGPHLGDRWDVSLVPNSPALDLGPSGTATDITGRPRPQGPASDAGIYEACSCPAFMKRPGT